jgi:assimilatory nitrate reductase catalytic subunit
VTEEFYTLGKLVQLGLGTSNYDGNTTLCMSTAVAGYKRSFGSDGPPGAYEDFERADVILLIGANIADNHPILCRRLDANPSATLIVVDPRVTKTAMMADLHLPIRPRSDLALLIHTGPRERGDRPRRRGLVPDRPALCHRPGSVHRLDHGCEPQLEGH